MKQVDILVIGGGPAGLCAACAAAQIGARVLICEQSDMLGGQLVKQTHKFFGCANQYAGRRGIEIARLLTEKVKASPNIEVWTEARVQGIFKDTIVGCEYDQKYIPIKADRVIIATGASEKFLAFSNNSLPGIFGAGAVQTLMNLYGVKPAKKALMIGSGNIGLIVAYQMKQAGVDVVGIVEAQNKVGGYAVHAAKIKRLGIPIKTSYTIVKALGKECVEAAVIAKLDENYQIIPGTEEKIECDCICIAVGLQPLADLCWQAHCDMKRVAELGGYVPLVNDWLETSNRKIYAAGDVSGVEEATAAMLEGEIAGTAAAFALGLDSAEVLEQLKGSIASLDELRAGPTGEKIRKGIRMVREGL